MISKEKLVFDPAAVSETDSIGAYLRASDGTLLTHTDVGGKKSLDVNVANTVAVSATDLDIRDLAFATDKVDVTGSEVSLDAATLAALENITVSATDLDIRDLAFATDSVTAHQGGTWTIDSITNAVTVSATDLDIRDLSFATDSVDVSGSEVSLDAATLAALENITVSTSHSSWLTSQNTVDTTAELVVAADLTNRKKVLIQNVSGNRTVYLGSSNAVTSADGIRLSPGSNIELELQAGVAIYAIANSAGADLRIAELAAI